jgi:uncharacterized protein YecT (DUF1311 family)
MTTPFIRTLAGASIFLLIAANVFADGQSSCSDLSQPQCLVQALKRADKQLNESYKTSLDGADEARSKSLRNAQRTWIGTRNRICRLQASMTSQEAWLEDLATDRDRAQCVYGMTISRIEEIRAQIPIAVTDESSLKEMNDYELPLVRAHGKGYAEIEVVAKGITADNTRIMQFGALSELQAFIGTQVPGEDMAIAAGESGIYTFGLAVDFDNGKWYWSANGKWQNAEPGSAQGADFKPGAYSIRVMSPTRPIQVPLSRGGIVINTGRKPFRYATPPGYEPYRVPAKSATGESYIDWMVAPYRNIEGLTLGQWAQRYWGWLLSKSAGGNPVLDITGERCADEQSGPVWFLAGGDANSHIRRRCKIPRGKYLFLPAFAQMLIAQKELGKTCAELEKAQIGRAGFGAQRGVFVKIDGERFDNLLDYRPYSVKCGPIMGINEQTIAEQAMFYGTFVLLQPLPPGDHVIEFGGTLPELQSFRSVAYELHVD